MSWHFSQALVAEFSAASCSAGEQSAPSKLTDTAETGSCSARTRDTCQHSQSGTMSELSTAGLGLDAWISSLAASRARTSAQQAKEQASPGSEADSGRKWPASLAKYDPDSRSWKTHQLSLLGDWEPFSETWPRWGTMRGGECWVQKMPSGICAIRASITSEPVSSCWRVPTPTVQDGRGRDRHNQKNGTVILSLLGVCQRFPTPLSRDYRTGDKPDSRRAIVKQSGRWHSPNLNDVAAPGGQLNPPWVEWLMGWPIGWTDSEPLATDKFQQWFDSHGRR